MVKNIVVLSDGTGQEGGKVSALNTNVYRLFNILENRTVRQIVLYQPGIGTGWRKVTGNVGGAGITRKILDAYSFISEHYEIGDRIYLVGFSRGAATMRSLSGFIDQFGILPKGAPELIKAAYKIYKTRAPMTKRRALHIIKKHNLDNLDKLEQYLLPENWHRVTKTNIRIFEMRHKASLSEKDDGSLPFYQGAIERTFFNLMNEEKDPVSYAAGILADFNDSPHENPREFVKVVERTKRTLAFRAANHSQPVQIEFLGCFDTVAALGLPFKTLNEIANRIPWLQHRFHNFNLSKSVRHAYHALAIDDVREQFKPVPWTLPIKREDDEVVKHKCDSPGCDETKPQRLHQVWFTGMHTDIGGGYLHDGLSNIALAWMLKQAHVHGILLDTTNLDDHREIVEDHTDVMHDSRDTRIKKFIFPYLQRNTEGFGAEKTVVHESVFLRVKADEIAQLENGNKEPDKTGETTQGLPGSSYQPWIIEGHMENGNEKIATEKWALSDYTDLLVAQEKKWQTWMIWVREREKERGNMIKEKEQKWQDFRTDFNG